ncbi:MAG TPA: DUF892 family protein [Bryobacteraceae bacterium]|jgi:ferritin-like metal-binding protein YciE
MAVTNAQELAIAMLSELRNGAERSQKIYEELGQAAQDPQVQEALDARGMVASQILTRLDQCFKLIGAKPVKVNERLHEIFIEDFRRELNEMQTPAARKLYVLAKASHLVHLQAAAYRALIAVADAVGHPGVGVLLESCLADKLAFADRARRLIRERIQQRVAAA